MKKIILHTMQLCVMGFMFVACQQPLSGWDAVRAELEQYADYTYNIHKQDSLEYFISQTGYQGYRVLGSGIFSTIEIIETEEQEAGKVNNRQIGSMGISVSMCDIYDIYNTTKRIDLYGGYSQSDQKEMEWAFGIGLSKPQPAVRIMQPDIAIDKDDIFLENESRQWIILKKGVGIAKFSDSNGLIWTSLRLTSQK